jgi:MFS family permease
LRDAIMVQAITPETRGRAFGFHRATDTIGAVVGPLLGVALLGWAQEAPDLTWADASGPFRLVFWLTLIPGPLAVLAFLLLVRDPEHSPNPSLQFWATLHELPAQFKRYLLAVGIFGIGDFSHSLLILAATQLLAPSMGIVRAAQVAGVLYVWRNVVQALASYPIGVAADHYGHRSMLILGYILGVATAVLAAAAFAFITDHLVILIVIFLVAGLYTAIQEALEPTVTAELVGQGMLATSYGALGTVNGGAKFVSSAGVGLLWTVVSPAFSFGVAALLMAAGTAVLSRSR